MQLEKIVTDWYTLFCSPSKINNLRNCVIYISYSNLQKVKKSINNIVNDASLKDFQRKAELSGFEPIIEFIKTNNKDLKSDYLETEELPFIQSNNSFIVIVKETKDIKLLNENLSELDINKEENDTIYVALIEEAQILTVKDSFCYTIDEYEIPVFVLNIRDKY